MCVFLVLGLDGDIGGKDVSGLGQTHGFDLAYIVEYKVRRSMCWVALVVMLIDRKSKDASVEFLTTPQHEAYVVSELRADESTTSAETIASRRR